MSNSLKNMVKIDPHLYIDDYLEDDEYAHWTLGLNAQGVNEQLQEFLRLYRNEVDDTVTDTADGGCFDTVSL